jgi:predicted transcriptional regulator
MMSLLNVMVDKGLLRRTPEGRAFRYAPRVKEQVTLRRLVGDLLDRAFGGSAHLLVAHALEHTALSETELEDLRALIDAQQTRREKRP